MFSKDSKPLPLLNDYENLALEIAKAIISNPNYEFRQEDKKKYFDKVNQTFDPKMKYELTIAEAFRYADALITAQRKDQ